MRRTLSIFFSGCAVMLGIAKAQVPPDSAPPFSEAAIELARTNARDPTVQERFRERQRASLAQTFRGVTTNGQPVEGLFANTQTNLSTAHTRRAAEAFLASLTAEQRRKTTFSIDDDEWRRWDNVPTPPSAPRSGVSLEELSTEQRELVFNLVRSSLSAKGVKTTEDIMKLNATLADLMRDERFGRWDYWITVMGTPSESEPWGWQLDGHHLVVNYFVLEDQVVMTPTFMGAEPVTAHTGPFAGTVVLQREQDKGQQLFEAFTMEQRAQARVAGVKGPANTIVAAYQDNAGLDYAGIPAAELSEAQRRLLFELIGEHVANLPDGHARLRMAEVSRHLDQTYFAWIGTGEPDDVFYYRVHSPVILIEFDHQSSARTPDAATRDHIHTIVRTPNGNDYGKDLLRQHYAVHPHAGP